MYIALELCKCSLLLSSEIWKNWQSVREHRWQVLALLKGERRSLMYGYTVLQRENLSSQCIISITQLRLGNFIETIIVSCKKKKNPVPCLFDECNNFPMCRTTRPCKEETDISLQVSWALQTHKGGLLSKLHKVDRKWGRSQSTIPIISLLTT